MNYDDSKKMYLLARDNMLQHFKSEKLTFSQVLDMKGLLSSQKFSRYFQTEMAKILGHSEEPEFSVYDARSGAGETQEYKYATYNEERGASFPQMMNLDYQPNTYVVCIFFENDLRVYEVPGEKMHKSIIRANGKRAHANNRNQLRINIKKRSEEMKFLESFYSQTLTNKLYKGTFSPLK